MSRNTRRRLVAAASSSSDLSSPRVLEEANSNIERTVDGEVPSSSLAVPQNPLLSEQAGSFLHYISQEHLKCLACHDTVRQRPIYQCHAGHTLCNACLLSLTHCPVCQVCIRCPGLKIRSMALEEIMNFVDVRCTYRDKGCPAVVKSENLKKHLLECIFGKFILCPSLGFEECLEEICPDNWKDHLALAHGNLGFVPGVKQHAVITYWDFMSTKTLKEGGFLKWTPLVLTPFPDTGPFMLQCTLDTTNSYTATFTVIYAPPVPVVGGDLASVSTSYFAKILIDQRSNNNEEIDNDCGSWVTDKFSWSGESVLISEQKMGSGSGVFQIPLGQYLPSDKSSETGGTRRTPAVNIKRDLAIKVGFFKTREDLEKPWPEDSIQENYLAHGVLEYSVSKNASFRASKCSECKAGPLRGVRYRCVECSKFHLCSKCMHEKEVHSHHAFFCIRSVDQNSWVTKNFKRMYRPGPPEEGLDSEDEDEPIPPPKRTRKVVTRRIAAGSNEQAASGSNN